MNKTESTEIYGEEVFGVEIDAETRCAHYHSPLDIIAIKFKCCERWFPCYQCHAQRADHQSKVWTLDERETKAILCGKCGHQLTISEYLESGSTCPNCNSRFNPKCALHYDLYFEIP